MTQTEKLIRQLAALKDGERSQLRWLLGKDLDETLKGFDLFTGIWWPLREQSPRAPERRSAWLVARLYAAYPVPQVRQAGAELALVLGLRERALRNEFDRQRFRARFDALLQAALLGLEPHLRWALHTVNEAVNRKQAAGLDWVRLLDDLRLWDRNPDKQDEDPKRREQDVRNIWANDYLNAVYQSERRS